jgi:short-subunit dehydrogenase
MKKILVIGATSAIAEATARLFAARGDALFLVARNAEHLRGRDCGAWLGLAIGT